MQEQATLFDFDCNQPKDVDHTEENIQSEPKLPATDTTTNDQADLVKFVDQYQKYIWKKGEEHRRRSVEQWKRFVAFDDNAALSLSDITTDHVMAFLDSLETQKAKKKGKGLCSPKTINRYAATISCVLKWAVRSKKLKSLIYVPLREEPKGRLLTYTPEQISQLVQYFRDHDLDFVVDFCLLAANTGMRKGEIEKIGTDKAILSGRKLTILDTKNGDDKVVTLNDACYEAALRLEKHSDFTHRKFYDAWQKARRDLKMSDDHVFHTFRHSFASHMANKLNANPLTLQKMMGHKRISTTQLYVHQDTDAQEQLTDQVAFG